MRKKFVVAILAFATLATAIQYSEQKDVSTPHQIGTPTAGKFDCLQHDSQPVVYPLAWQCKIDALEVEGLILDSCETDSMDDDKHYVKHGSVCNVVSQDPVAKMSVPYTVLCQFGQWKASGTASALGEPVSADVSKIPPKYETCPPDDIQREYVTEAGREEVTITWEDPTACDDDGSIVSNLQVAGATKNGSFAGSTSTGGRQHTILYEARDDDGMTAFCYFSFTVKIRTCDALLWPSNGYRHCTNDNILGSTCTYRCNEGFTLANDISEATCTGEDEPRWSATPSCEKISCSAPPDVTDGAVTCNSGHEYGDYCTISCRDGYRLQGQVFTRCEADGKWFWGVPTTCTDDVAPELSCKTPQIFYADWAASSVSVYWEIPSATDNVDIALNATQTRGPEPGTVIEAGRSEVITYVATDAAGNQSPLCNIEVRVEVTRCDHPLNTLEDARLRFACNSTPSYIYGDTCTLACSLNLPLEGADQITCQRNDTGVGPPVGYWDWGNGSMPFCHDISCPPLQPPQNGALVFDWISGRPTTTMLCNEAYDAPDLGAGFNGIFFCQDSGQWNPYYENKAPDCSETFSSRGYVLPSKLFYYKGTCGVNDTVLENFASIVDDMKNFFAILCPPGTVCEPQNPKVTCGKYDRKKRSEGSYILNRRLSKNEISHVLKKRQTEDVLVFSFDIAAFFDTSQMTKKEQYAFADKIQLELIKPALQSRVVSGDFDRPGFAPLQADSFETAEYGDPYCDPGSIPVRQTKCNKCPAGHFEFERSCLVCPIGQYSTTSGAVACTPCPDGYSTRHHASYSLENCTQLCTPGTYSPDTFAPCSPCKSGFYQPNTRQSQCLACPMGMSTKSPGSKTSSDCQWFDAYVTNTGDDTIEIDIPMMNNLGIEFYTKTSTGTPNITISVDSKLDIAISDTITVTTASTNDVLGPSSDNAWVQVKVYWDTQNGNMNAFYRGNLAVHHSSMFSTSRPLVKDGHLYISASGEAVASISGLRVLDAVPDKDVSATATSCHMITSSDVVTMDAFKTSDKINLMVPSVCNVIDECLSSPCGGHGTCKNVNKGFTCICHSGWTGITCSTPPDYCIGNACKNDAVCISGTANYTCQCRPGFCGVFCEIPPVNGGWSVWSTWTECSAPCNTGSRDRTRSCDSPAPDLHGQDCVGVDIETEDCNADPCPECPAIVRGYAALPKCVVHETGTLVCTATCKEGYVRPPGLGNDTYTCGMETDFIWQPKQHIPACVKPELAESYTVVLSGSLDHTVSAEDEEVYINGISSNMESTPCVQSGLCTFEVSLEESNERKKRNTGTTVSVTFSIKISDTSDLQLDQLTRDGTISPGLQETVDAIQELEATATAINGSASTFFDVTTDDSTYSVDTNSITFDGAAICRDGEVVTHGLCAECPVGSSKVGAFCSLCNKGTYQDQTGRTSCTQCPAGYTTESVGSESIDDCFGSTNVKGVLKHGRCLNNGNGFATRLPTQPPQAPLVNKGSHVGLTAVTFILAGMIVITGGVVAFILCRRHMCKSRPKLMHVQDFPICNMAHVSKYAGVAPPSCDRPSTAASTSGIVLYLDRVDDETKVDDKSLYA